MHYLGMIGQPRRTHSYNEGHGFEAWNQIATVGSFILGVGVFIGVVQFIHSFYSKKLKPAGKKSHGTLGHSNGLCHHLLKIIILPELQSSKLVIKHGKIITGKKNRSEKRALGRSWRAYARPIMVSSHHCIWTFVMAIGLLFHQSIDASGELARDYTIAIAGGGVFVIGVIMWAIEGPRGYHLFPKENEE